MFDLIKCNTELILSNIELIQKYNEKINYIEFSEHKKYFTKELGYYRNQVLNLKEEIKQWQAEIDNYKNSDRKLGIL